MTEGLLESLHRIFLGDKSLMFLVEVAFRTIVIFSYTLVLLRWMGKRGMGQLSPFEFAIIVALGSAVGDPMFYDDVPLVHTMLVIAIVIGLQRLLHRITQTSEAVDNFIAGETKMLVQCGRIDIEQLKKERLLQGELFELLRTEGISHLGQVRQAFLEPSGRISVIRWEPTRSGLSILPTKEDAQRFDVDEDPTQDCCSVCGACNPASEPTTSCVHPECKHARRLTSICDAS